MRNTMARRYPSGSRPNLRRARRPASCQPMPPRAPAAAAPAARHLTPRSDDRGQRRARRWSRARPPRARRRAPRSRALAAEHAAAVREAGLVAEPGDIVGVADGLGPRCGTRASSRSFGLGREPAARGGCTTPAGGEGVGSSRDVQPDVEALGRGQLGEAPRLIKRLLRRSCRTFYMRRGESRSCGYRLRRSARARSCARRLTWSRRGNGSRASSIRRLPRSRHGHAKSDQISTSIRPPSASAACACASTAAPRSPKRAQQPAPRRARSRGHEYAAERIVTSSLHGSFGCGGDRMDRTRKGFLVRPGGPHHATDLEVVRLPRHLPGYPSAVIRPVQFYGSRSEQIKICTCLQLLDRGREHRVSHFTRTALRPSINGPGPVLHPPCGCEQFRRRVDIIL